MYISSFLRRKKALFRLVYKVIYKKVKKYYLKICSPSSIFFNLIIALDPSIKLDIYRVMIMVCHNRAPSLSSLV